MDNPNDNNNDPSTTPNPPAQDTIAPNKINVSTPESTSSTPPVVATDATDAPLTEAVPTTGEPDVTEVPADTSPNTPVSSNDGKDTIDPLTIPMEPEVFVPPSAEHASSSVIAGAVKKPFFKTKKFAVISILLLLGVSVGGAAAYSLNNEQPVAQLTNTQVTKSNTLMGAELIIADGTVQISTDNKTWKAAGTGDQITQGVYVKTLADSRAVIAIDDGSAVRIDSLSSIKVKSLDTQYVVIQNLSGSVYSRLVASDRTYSVEADDESYIAMGTAYIVRNSEAVRGVEVYESTVKVDSTDTSVPEGKYYYEASTDSTQVKKLADIPVDKVKADAFLAWNYQLDKTAPEFKDKLGYLSKIDEAAPASTTPASSPAQGSQASAGIVLSGSAYSNGVKLTWQLNGVSAPKGFKVVKSSSANPTYSKDDSRYLAEPDARSYSWDMSNGKEYHFRVCIYDGSGCSAYSNDITVTAPVASAPSAGTLTLTNTGGKDYSWTLNGSAPKGYKLVWSKSENPVYPGSSYVYNSSESDKTGTVNAKSPGTYYVRVCIYNGNGACIDGTYSNQHKLVIN